MRALLDTHVLLWWLFDSPKLSTPVCELLINPSNAIYVSAASAWEISTKHRLGKLEAVGPLLDDFSGCVTRARFQELPISMLHSKLAGAFPHDHRDPFDRMFAAQALAENLLLVTRDSAFTGFKEIETFW